MIKSRTLALSTLALCALAGSAGAQTRLIVSEYLFEGARVISMNPDGSDVQTLFTLPTTQWLPLGISYNAAAGKLIWIDSAGSSEVMSSNLDGTANTVLASVPGFARGAQLDNAGRVFFVSNNFVYRVDADGSNLTPLYAPSVSTDPLGNAVVDAVNGHLYVGVENEIRRMDLNGENVKTIHQGVSIPRALGLDVGRNYLYWIDADTGSDHVARVHLDGSGFEIVRDLSPANPAQSGLIDMLVDPVGQKIYFADEFATNVQRMDLDGSNWSVIYMATGGLAPSGFALTTGVIQQELLDCNDNGIADGVEIAGGAPDCDNNGFLDSCQASPCPTREFLLDNLSAAADFSGRAVGQPSQWQVFQPFDVPAGGWSIGEIGVDGYTYSDVGEPQMTVSLFRDDGSGNLPNEGAVIASGAINLRYGTNFSAWQYGAFPASIPEGRYWLRLKATDPVQYGGSINFGLTGLASRSKAGTSGNFSNNFFSPVAVRLVEGTPCFADIDNGSGTGTGDGGVDINDLLYFLSSFEAGATDADVDDDGNSQFALPDGGVDVNDLLFFLARFEAGC